MYIDMHNHTVFSDGSDTVENTLAIAEREKLSAVSITDHNSVKGYYPLRNKDVRSIFSGSVVTGTELTTLHNNVPVEILGYNFDLSEMDERIGKFKLPNEQQYQRFQAEKLLKVIEKLGVRVDMSKREQYLLNWRILYKELQLNHKDFLDELNPEFAVNHRRFFREGFNNKNSPLAVNYNDFLLPAEEGIAAIHASGGVASCAHPSEYGDRAGEVLRDLPKRGLDGIECYHPSADAKRRGALMDICKRKGLIITGGGDAHGIKNKMNSEHVPEALLAGITKGAIRGI